MLVIQRVNSIEHDEPRRVKPKQHKNHRDCKLRVSRFPCASSHRY